MRSSTLLVASMLSTRCANSRQRNAMLELEANTSSAIGSSAALAARVEYLFRKFLSLNLVPNNMKLAATGRAVRLVWIERSRIRLRCKTRIWIGSIQHQRRHQYTSKDATWPTKHGSTLLIPCRRSKDSGPRNRWQ